MPRRRSTRSGSRFGRGGKSACDALNEPPVRWGRSAPTSECRSRLYRVLVMCAGRVASCSTRIPLAGCPSLRRASHLGGAERPRFRGSPLMRPGAVPPAATRVAPSGFGNKRELAATLRRTAPIECSRGRCVRMARFGPGTARTACSVGRTAAGSACRLKTPGSVDTGGPNERCGRNDAKRRPCGRLREVRPEPGLALSRARRAPRRLRGGRAPCDPRGPLRRPRLGAHACHCPAGVAGADWREPGSDRRQNRPPGQWRQGD